MLIEFRVGNYRSFKERVTFSMVAANLVEKDPQLNENNFFRVDDNLRLLKSSAIYGANASGKSNLIKALGFMRFFMISSSKDTQSTDEIEVEQFKLDFVSESEPSYFEIIFVMDKKKYRYGFEANRDQVIAEWLFYVPKLRETRLFERRLDDISVSKIYKAAGIQEKTRKNALFLSVSAQFNVAIAKEILSWVNHNLKVFTALNDLGYQEYTISCLKSDTNKNEMLHLLKKLDLGFSDVKVEEIEITSDSLPSGLPDDFKKFILSNAKGRVYSTVQTIHHKFDEGKPVSQEIFDLANQESDGTQKVFALLGPLVDALKNGKTLVIDEFDSRLHPLISRAIVELFNSNATNLSHAQLIFATHDTNLLSNKLFRRDQVWFTEKNRYGSTTLYSLAEYRVRNDASFGKDYIQGKYGAVPFIGDLSNLIVSYE